MATTWSPEGAGGLCHIQRAKSTSTLAQLRRSLSRSPSKTLAAAFPSSAKKARPQMRRSSPMSGTFALDVARSPAKRALSELTDNGNATPQSSISSASGAENDVSPSPTPAQASETKAAVGSSVERYDQYLSPNMPRARKDRPTVGFSDIVAKSSPLKRGDETRPLDLTAVGSPAKRRSLHFPSVGTDFDIFDAAAAAGSMQTPHQQTPMERSSSDHLSAESPTRAEFGNVFTPMPKRASSLRRTTLQQRHDKPIFSKARPNASLALEMQTPAGKMRPRLSLDNPVPHPNRGSPFTNTGALPNASVHPLSTAHNDRAEETIQAAAARHPLSRTLTTSSSSSFVDDSPTHIPVRHVDPKPKLDFSKSLPLGAARPVPEPVQASEPSSQETHFTTPENYKLAKPLPAAFMSTGLISKRHKNLSQEQLDFAGSGAHMPDTPCKRALPGMNPAPTPNVNAFKSSHNRHVAFGAPSTPFHNITATPAPKAFGKSASIFGSSFNAGSHNRRGSFVANDDNPGSPLATFQSSKDVATFRVPPTPTKPSTLTNPVSSPEVEMPDAVTPGRDGSESPMLEMNSSPIMERQARKPPQTPSENMVPPDPSSLSISGAPRGEPPLPPSLSRNNSALQASSLFLPATPTAPRDSLGRIGSSIANVSVTPVHQHAHAAPVDVDRSLTSRFERVELVGNGEFSQVFRVMCTADEDSVIDPTQQCYFTATSADAPNARPVSRRRSRDGGDGKRPNGELVWAVKKTRNAFIGPRDRRRKLQEVEVLRALGSGGEGAAHTLRLFDSWEVENHLYIQTEYCDEGSLDGFLDRVGRQWRVDDFRIWKIMLELSMGLKHVHDLGFIHLDLKPANVLITFEGALKLADFGLASPWPAPPGTEGEGDREYIGPEILLGRFDKPADVFALGLVLLEIAGNVMLPENGASWQRLRSGDMSDVPSLTSGSTDWSSVSRDAQGNPVEIPPAGASAELFRPRPVAPIPEEAMTATAETAAATADGATKPGTKPPLPPAFALDPHHEHSLDNLVRWMIRPAPEERPAVDQLLEHAGLQWARVRRRAGATVFEGSWGPADEILASDSEMMMVDSSF